MICPKCLKDKTRVIDTVKTGPIVKRVRVCQGCLFSFHSTERPYFTLFDKEEVDAYEEYITEELAQSKGQ